LQPETRSPIFSATQLAVDSQIEQRSVSQSLLAIEEEADRPDLLLSERALWS